MAVTRLTPLLTLSCPSPSEFSNCAAPRREEDPRIAKGGLRGRGLRKCSDVKRASINFPPANSKQTLFPLALLCRSRSIVRWYICFPNSLVRRSPPPPPVGSDPPRVPLSPSSFVYGCGSVNERDPSRELFMPSYPEWYVEAASLSRISSKDESEEERSWRMSTSDPLTSVTTSWKESRKGPDLEGSLEVERELHFAFRASTEERKEAKRTR